MRHGLTGLVVLGMVLGLVFGVACHAFVHDPGTLKVITGGLELATTIFLRTIKMIIAPLVFATLVTGVARMGDSGAVGRVAGRALLWFLVASLVSLGIGLATVVVLHPGTGLHLQAASGAAAGLKAPPLTAVGFVEHLIPTSIIDAMARNEVLQIVVFAVVAGVAIGNIGPAGRELLRMSEALSTAMLKMTTYVMYLAPIAVFAAVARALAEQGLEVVGTYASYVGGFYLALALLWAVMMAAGAAVLGPQRQWELIKTIRQPALIALSTTSSEAAYPVLLEKLEAFGVPNRIASFVLPLGYSFNLVGSMCYCTFAALFVAQAYDIQLSGAQIAQLLLLLFVTSKGIASVPRASLLVVASALPYFKIPDAGVLLILAVDHFLDMGRTATNTVGNSIAAASVAKWEGATIPAAEMAAEPILEVEG
ncbi:MAG: C4-dicarboxylate transporter [Phenylobacterium sp.]|nr:C4-dicarboxylate transporter [Phenylobacterium sp.]